MPKESSLFIRRIHVNLIHKGRVKKEGEEKEKTRNERGEESQAFLSYCPMERVVGGCTMIKIPSFSGFFQQTAE
jgi:quinol-cytochrome oxidoreductase complex cytochrome b subunit